MTRRRWRTAGFTLVEVLVALAVMATMAGLAWRGVDTLLGSTHSSSQALDATLRLQATLTQWEADLHALTDTQALPALQFDGATVRLTRHAGQDGAAGVQLVAWSLREGSWWRWASPPATEVSALRGLWQRSQVLLGSEPGTVRTVSSVNGLQLYFFRGNAWSNAQSSGDAQAQSSGDRSSATGVGTASGAVPVAEKLPQGVRVVLSLPSGSITRDLVLGPQLP